MNTRLNQAAQRATRYWYIDGINEIAFGGYCLVIGAYFYLQHNLPPGSPLYAVFSIAFIFLILGGSYAMRWGINRAKERLTYPRTGYVGYKSRPRKYRLVILLAAILIAILVVSLIGLGSMEFDWVPALNGLIVSAGWAWAAYRVGMRRFYILALICLVGAVGIAFAGLGNYLGLAVFYTLAGLASLFSGTCTLVNYLRDQPKQEAAGE